MYFPTIKRENNIAHGVSENFAGLNRSNFCIDNEFSDMKNCGSQQFPFVCARPSRELIYSTDETIKCLHAPPESVDEEFKFTGIADNKLYYRGVEKDISISSPFYLPYPYNDSSKYPELQSTASPSVVSFTDEVYTFPSLAGFNVLGAEIPKSTYQCNNCPDARFWNLSNTTYGDYSEIEWYGDNGSSNKFELLENCLIKAGDIVDIIYSADTEINNCTFTSEDPNLIKNLLSEHGTGRNKIYTATVLEVVTSFRGDYEIVSGFKVALTDIKGNSAYFVGTDGVVIPDSVTNNKNIFESINLKIRKHQPLLSYSCEFAGRVFALDPYGKNIYASKLLEPMNFTQYDGKSDSSWYTEVSSPGEWVGIIASGNYVYCFKKDIVYVLFGDNANNFTIGKTFTPGCIDGRSICVSNNYIYYLSSGGLYCYSASVPTRVDQKLGEFKYTAAVCKAFDSKIYMAATREDGTRELVVYDTEKNVFFIEDDLEIVDFVVYRNHIYAATPHEVYKFNSGSEDFEFSVTSKQFTDASSYMRSVVSLNFRMKFAPGSDASVYISYDDNDWQMCGYIINGKIYHPNSSLDVDRIKENIAGDVSHKPNSIYMQRVPVRFRASNTYKYKIVCHGSVVIESIERNIAMAGQEMR